MQIKAVMCVVALLCISSLGMAQADLSDIPGAARVSAYVEAFNQGEAAMEGYIRENITEAALKERPVEARLATYRRIREDQKTLELRRVVGVQVTDAGRTISTIMRSGNGNFLRFDFVVEAAPHHKVISISAEFLGQDEQQAMAGAATPLADVSANIAKLKDMMAQAQVKGFRGGILVAQNGRVLFQQGYGYANRAEKAPINEQTVFDIASCVKDFTQVAIYQLAEAGKISLDDPLSKFLKDVPADRAEVTIRQLLEHRAGLPHAIAPDAERLTKDEFLKRVFEVPLISKPGEAVNYSNPGYSLLAAIIEQVSGKAYEAYLQENVFAKLGLHHIGYATVRATPEQIAHSYSSDKDFGSTLDYPHLTDGPSWTLRGNGGMLATLEDMYAFYRGWRGGLLTSKEHALNRGGMLAGANPVHSFAYRMDQRNNLELVLASTVPTITAMTLDGYVMGTLNGRSMELPTNFAAKDVRRAPK